MADFTFKANTTFLEEKYVTWAEVGLDSPDLSSIPASIWSFGRNNNGQLGLGDITYRSSPVQIGTLTDWKQVSTGGTFSLAIKTDGSLWAWGNNFVGQLGLGTSGSGSSRSSPVQVGSLTNWKQVSAGSNHTAAIKTDGTLWSWGGNQQGQLGLNDVTYRSSPVQVGSLTDWKQISAGTQFTLAVKTDGSLWSWGYNKLGELGSGTNGGYYGIANRRSSPVQVGSLTNWRSVAACSSTNGNHVLAVKTDGTLWSWGRNNTGQLGLGDTAHRSSPVQVGSMTNWKKASPGYLHTVAIKTDGTLWSWGNNTYNGRLGLGDLTSRSSPTQIGTLSNWSSVEAGRFHNAAIKTDGTLWTWGGNTYGELGLGDKTHRSSPVQVGSLTTWKSLDVRSQNHTLVLKNIT